MTEGRFPCKAKHCRFVGRADWELRDHIKAQQLCDPSYDHSRECEECGFFEGYHTKECSKSITSRLAPAVINNTKIMAEAVTRSSSPWGTSWQFNDIGLWDFGSAAMDRMPVGQKVRVTIEVVEEGNAI